jgi:hypothetical protein
VFGEGAAEVIRRVTANVLDTAIAAKKVDKAVELRIATIG